MNVIIAPQFFKSKTLKNGENAFVLASSSITGRDLVEEFLAAKIWPISNGWEPEKILWKIVTWCTSSVP